MGSGSIFSHASRSGFSKEKLTSHSEIGDKSVVQVMKRQEIYF